MDRRYASLLSEGGLARPSTPVSSGSEQSSEALPPDHKRRRIGVSIACNECRRKKIRCDGQRPVCSHCRARNIPFCEYRDDAGLSSESSKFLVEVVRLLNRIPATEMVPTLKRLDKADAQTIISTLRGRVEALPSGSAGRNTAAAELKWHYPLAYPHTVLLNTRLLDSSSEEALAQLFRQTPNLLPERSSSTQPAPMTSPAVRSTSKLGPDAQANGAALSLRNNQSATKDKVPPRRLCDPRLARLHIGRWTSVEMDDALAARCISLYLETDHPLLGHFDSDLFLDDLVAEHDGERPHCSPLLVNALLYWACQMYSAIDPSTDALAIAFCTEAERIWDDQRRNGQDSVLGMAAAQFLSLGYLGQGRDHASVKYLYEACSMGVRLGLFERWDETAAAVDTPTRAQADDSHDERPRQFAAWGIFNFAALMALFYHQPGIRIALIAPQLPIPRSSHYHSGPELGNSPLQGMGQTFPHLCRFWKVVHEVSVVYRKGGRRPWAFGSDVVFAEFKFRELLAWSNTLPAHLSSEYAESPHHVQVMHVWFHAAVLDLFRPFTANPAVRDTALRTFSGGAITLQMVYTSSTTCLKHLLVNYHRYYAPTSHTLLWHTGLLYGANAILETTTDEAKQQDPYIKLILYGYMRLSATWRVAKAICKALLSMMMRQGDMSSRMAWELQRHLDNTEDKGEGQGLGGIRAPFMMNLQQAQEQPEASTVESLADEFEANAMMMEYTNVLEKK